MVIQKLGLPQQHSGYFWVPLRISEMCKVRMMVCLSANTLSIISSIFKEFECIEVNLHVWVFIDLLELEKWKPSNQPNKRSARIQRAARKCKKPIYVSRTRSRLPTCLTFVYYKYEADIAYYANKSKINLALR